METTKRKFSTAAYKIDQSFGDKMYSKQAGIEDEN